MKVKADDDDYMIIVVLACWDDTAAAVAKGWAKLDIWIPQRVNSKETFLYLFVLLCHLLLC